MPQLPIYQDPNKNLMLLQRNWGNAINPILGNPASVGLLIPNVSLVIGSNVISHLLDRQMQGWSIADITFPGTVYRDPTKPFNDKTLTLISSANGVVNLEVF